VKGYNPVTRVTDTAALRAEDRLLAGGKSREGSVCVVCFAGANMLMPQITAWISHECTGDASKTS
jgi:hypothetical protein